MAKKTSQNKKVKNKSFHLEPETKREILAIFFLTLAALSAFSYFGLASLAGNYLDLFLQKLFGDLRLLFVGYLIVLGIFYLSSRFRPLLVFGLTFLFFSILGFVQLLEFPGQEGFKMAWQGQGGGLAGQYLAFPLYQIFGFWAGIILFLAFIFISLTLILPRPIFFLLSSHQVILRFLGEVFSALKRFKLFTSKKSEQENIFAIHSVASLPSEEEVLPEENEEKGKAESETQETQDRIAFKKPKQKFGKIELPLDLLAKNDGRPTAGDIRARSLIIQKTLQNFGIEVEMGEVSVGPTVTQYTLRPAEGIKLSSITALQNDLALALAAHPIRIEAPIPGKSLVGIEVPNEKVALVTLREVLESEEARKSTSNLTIALGKDVAGKVWVADLAKMPHLLIAGATGSGKTVCLNTIIISLLYRNSPAELRFIFVDPKRVELPIYNDIPHLLTPVITDVKKTIQVLRWTILEMERRFDCLQKVGARDIKSFNAQVSEEEKLPYIVFIVDELADLMVAAASDVEGSIIRLAQMARAVGIHLILATQRPSVDILTGLIKANITSRIAFAVASAVDSRTILDTAGAEKLLGRGDMLFVTPELGKPKRIQGAYVSDEEIKRVVNYLKNQGSPEYIDIQEAVSSGNAASSLNDEEGDPLLPEAKRVIWQAKKASASLLQRRLAIGYARAARILDLLEAEGFIGPADGAKPREILKSPFSDNLSSEKENAKIENNEENI